MALKYRCPDMDCRKTFAWDAADGEPQRCPHCGYMYDNGVDDGVIHMPNILSARSKSIESVARGVMDGSEVRAEIAAEMTGGSKEDFSALKVTNLNDGRQSEYATKDVSNPVTQAMEAAPGITGFQPNAGLAYSGAVNTGPHPRAGARQATKLTMLHQQHKQALAVSGKTR